MAIYTPDQLREWLENMLRFNGKDADRAQALLEIMDEHGDAGEDRGFRKSIEDSLDGLVDAKQDDAVCAAVERLAQLAEDLNELMRDAGLLGKEQSEMTTDIVPTLRMFLPVG